MSDTGARKTAPKLTIDQAPMPESDTERAAEREGVRAAASEIGEEAVGFIKGLGASLWAYAASHHYTVLYGFIGFVLAVLILTIGLWSTIVIAVFAGVGATLGQIRDGDNGIVNFFRRLFSGKR
ncbi:DUF2273 domain-containing protein [Collinsella tanakaei]|uniref:DUF2273 domain-containing protein n=1 Tax=Collinsella tanakaei TaxID=626935 RepID=UPI00195A6BD3|nr:DUF2273 domain-containing protein [Collinsella tanakaei]MBM6779673.1 DUF2273 domain-containing protein [Collinsella tanakaei]